MPDAVFVQDAAIVFDELAVIAHPGAESRRPETESVAQALPSFDNSDSSNRLAHSMVATFSSLAATYVGLSARTNAEGVRQLAEFLGPYGYVVQGVPITGCLHLQSRRDFRCGQTVARQSSLGRSGSVRRHRVDRH